MRRVGPLEAERLGAQQHRPAPAREAKQPPAADDQRQGRDPELPLIEPGEDADGLPDRVGETIDRGKQPPDTADNAGCQQNGPFEAGRVLFHRPRPDGFPDQILSGPQPWRYADLAILLAIIAMMCYHQEIFAVGY